MKEMEYTKPLIVYFCGHEKCNKGHFFGPAVRSQYLIHIILDGKGRYQVGTNEYHLQKGDAFLIYPNEIVYYQADKENPWSYAWVGFEGHQAKKILEHTGFQNCILHGRERVEEMFQCMKNLEEAFLENANHEFKVLGNFYLLLSTMLEDQKEQGIKTSFEEQYMNKALDYIRHNYVYAIKIQDIANYVGIDRTYLYRLFIKSQKCSPKTYLTMYRMEMAKDMLKTMKYTATEIAYSCGFKDLAAFCNQFKKIVKMTPIQFKSNHHLD